MPSFCLPSCRCSYDNARLREEPHHGETYIDLDPGGSGRSSILHLWTGGSRQTPDEIRYYVDGVVVRTVENTHWHQPLFLIFDSETMPKWFGMPDDEDLPSTYSIEYVRAWKQEQ